jgi:hypothetical protein
MPRPQFRLRSLFILTAIVAVGCLVGPSIITKVQDWLRPEPAQWEPTIISPGRVTSTAAGYKADFEAAKRAYAANRASLPNPVLDDSSPKELDGLERGRLDRIRKNFPPPFHRRSLP